MKKTLISLVLVFALLSTCVFSAVFAAYTTSKSGTVVATVSAFGIEAITVSTTAVTLLPGMTEATLAQAKVEGKPAVNVEISYEADMVVASDAFKVKNAQSTEVEYFPIIITVGTESYGTLTKNEADEHYHKSNTIADLITAVEAAVASFGKTTVTAGTTITAGFVEVATCVWASDDDFATDSAMDSQLGETKTVEEETVAVDTFSFTLTAKVTQK